VIYNSFKKLCHYFAGFFNRLYLEKKGGGKLTSEGGRGEVKGSL